MTPSGCGIRGDAKDPTLRDLRRYFALADKDMEKEREAEERERKAAEEALESLPSPARFDPAQIRLQVRLRLEAEADRAGETLDDLLSALRRGRLTSDEHHRRDILATAVWGLRKTPTHITFQVIADSLVRKVSTVEGLVARGRQLAAQEEQERQKAADAERRNRQAAIDDARRAGCAKHGRFRDGCPRCIQTREEVGYAEPEDDALRLFREQGARSHGSTPRVLVTVPRGQIGKAHPVSVLMEGDISEDLYDHESEDLGDL